METHFRANCPILRPGPGARPRPPAPVACPIALGLAVAECIGFIAIHWAGVVAGAAAVVAGAAALPVAVTVWSALTGRQSNSNGVVFCWSSTKLT